MSVFALFGIVSFQAGGTFEDAPRVPDRKVTTYEVTCKGTYAQISFAEDFTMAAGNESIVRTVTLLNLGHPAPKAS